MNDLSQNTALAIAVQSAADAYASPTSADCYPISNLRPSINGITITNPEYLGTVHAPGDAVIGKTLELSFTIVIRPPGGASPPSAGAFIPGRVLRAAGFTENLIAAAIPAAAEPLGGGSTTSMAKLGTTAAATADLYKGLVVNLPSNGSYPRSLAAIRAYAADKSATLPETFGSAPTGNYQIPKQLAYQLSASAPVTFLSASFWLGGRRFNGINLAVSALKFNFPTAGKDAQAFPTIDVTLAGDLYSDADETAPVLAPLGAIPVFRDGDFWLSNTALGGSSFTVDMGLKVGYPPNANKTNGNDPAQIVQTKRTVNVTLNQQLKATFDLIGKADGQAYHSTWAQYGYTAGAIVSFIVPDARFNYQSPDPSGDFVTTGGDLFIDGADKAINLIFPY
jgi:hypothetical protein